MANPAVAIQENLAVDRSEKRGLVEADFVTLAFNFFEEFDYSR